MALTGYEGEEKSLTQRAQRHGELGESVQWRFLREFYSDNVFNVRDKRGDFRRNRPPDRVSLDPEVFVGGVISEVVQRAPGTRGYLVFRASDTFFVASPITNNW